MTETEDSLAYKALNKKADEIYNEQLKLSSTPTPKDMKLFYAQIKMFLVKNINAIKFVGEGSSRIVFAMADGTAIKLAKSVAGRAQNK